jgi:exodeoxyribonuclease V gamma subunit
MPMHLHRGPALAALAARLAASLDAAPPADPFAPHVVVVGSRGMERWLRAQLAQHHGICANVRFLFPAAALEQVLGDLVDPRPDPDPWAPQALAFTILRVLPDIFDDPAMAPVRAWLADDADAGVDRRRWGLARELADVLDRYHLARPELVGRFLARAPTDDPTEAWQGVLWRACRAAIGAPCATERLVAAIEALRRGARPSLPALHLFGISALPPAWLALLDAVAARVPVHLLLFVPSEHYWADFLTLPDARALARRGPEALAEAERALARQHPLLTSLGRLSRDMQALLAELVPNAHEPAPDALLPDAPPRSALDRLKHDLRALAVPEPPHPLAEDDWSLQIHACAGPARQAHALRDALLRAFDLDRTLEPRDVVVLTPDIDTYGPLVQAALEAGGDEPGDRGWTASGGPRLPCAVSDGRLGQGNAFAEALLTALRLAHARVDAPALLDLLRLPPVAARFGLDEHDLTTARRLVEQSGFRWAFDAEDRRRHGQPADAQNTLTFALRRLALGALRADDGTLLDAGDDPSVSPVDDLEGAAVASFGRLAALADAVQACAEDLRPARPVAAQVEALRAALSALTAPDPESRADLQAVHDALDGLARDAADLPAPVQPATLHHLLSRHFDDARHPDRPITGAVTVSALTPMRSVPFRIVCLVGLDDGVFPRDRSRPAWDLVATRPAVGDRDPRDEDRHLLLEAIFAAGDALIVTCTGVDPQRGAEVPLPLPVADLVDALDRSFTRDGAGAGPAFVHRPPLQAASPASFHGPAPSFDARAARLVAALAGPRAPWRGLPPGLAVPCEPEPAIDVDRLATTLAHPQRALCRRLRIRPPDEVDAAARREPVDLDALDRWGLLDRAIATLGAADGADRALADLPRRLRARGEVQPGAPGRVQAARIAETAADLHAAAASLREPARTRVVDLPLPDGRRLVGRVPDVGPAGPVLLSPSGVHKPRNLMIAWVRLLALAAGGHATAAWVVGKAPRGDGAATLRLRAPDAPLDALCALIDAFDAAVRAPVLLLPGVSPAVAARLAEPAEDGAVGPDRPDAAWIARRAADGAWSSAGFDGATRGDVTDDAVRTVLGDAPPYLTADGALDPAAVTLAWAVWGPLYAHLSDGEGA